MLIIGQETEGRPLVQKAIEQIRWCLQISGSLITRTISMQLGLQNSMVHRILSENLFLFSYELQNHWEFNNLDKKTAALCKVLYI